LLHLFVDVEAYASSNRIQWSSDSTGLSHNHTQ